MSNLDSNTTRFVAGCMTVLLLVWMVRGRKYVAFRAWPFWLYFGDQPPPERPKR